MWLHFCRFLEESSFLEVFGCKLRAINLLSDVSENYPFILIFQQILEALWMYLFGEVGK